MKINKTLKLIILAITSNTFFTFYATAAIWHVSNVGNNANFPSIIAAHDSEKVLAGDTLYVYGTTKPYYDFVCSKKLNIIGPGYFLNENQDTQANINTATISNLTYNPGSEGSSISGMTIGNVNFKCSDITIKRNRFMNNSPYSTVAFSSEVQNIIIVQNFIEAISGIQFSTAHACNNIIIFNNLIIASYANEMYGHCNAIIKNNVIKGEISIFNSLFYNNIHIGKVNIENSDVKCNIGNFGTINGNKSVDISTIFVVVGSQDSKYQLAEDSPAKNAGVNGIDCGAFDGTDPYILSGIPMIPTIYYVDIPVIASEISGLPVQIKIKSRN